MCCFDAFVRLYIYFHTNPFNCGVEKSLMFINIILAMVALSDHFIEGQAFAWIAVVVLPVNAAANPVIYTLLAVWQQRVI